MPMFSSELYSHAESVSGDKFKREITTVGKIQERMFRVFANAITSEVRALGASISCSNTKLSLEQLLTDDELRKVPAGTTILFSGKYKDWEYNRVLSSFLGWGRLKGRTIFKILCIFEFQILILLDPWKYSTRPIFPLDLSVDMFLNILSFVDEHEHAANNTSAIFSDYPFLTLLVSSYENRILTYHVQAHFIFYHSIWWGHKGRSLTFILGAKFW